MRTNQRSVEVPRLLLKDPAAAVTPSAVTAELQANLPLSAPPTPRALWGQFQQASAFPGG